MGIGASFTAATRHAMDINLSFGSASSRYGAREDYRNTYDGGQRIGAGLGVAFGTAVPAIALGTWALKRGARTPLAPLGFAPQGAAKVAAVAALGGATVVGALKMKQIIEDDGHIGSAASAAGIVAGAAGGLWVGKKFAGRYAPIVSGVGMIAGGIAGYQLGKRVEVGEGNIGKKTPATPRVDSGALDRAKSFGMGMFNHFTEVGPSSQGVSLATAWGMREAYDKTSTNSERAGGMAGDLLAAGILGGGAFAAAKVLMKGDVAGAAHVAGEKVLAKGFLTGGYTRLQGMGAAGVGAAAAGIAGLVLSKERSRFLDNGDSAATANIKTGALLAATAGTAALVSKAPAFSGLAAAPRAAASALTAAVLIGVLSSARLPVQQFMNDAQSAHELGNVDKTTMYGASAIGGGMAGFGAFKLAKSMVPAGGITIPKINVRIPAGVLIGLGTAVGAAAGAGVGWGLSATMPDMKKVGIGAATGAVAGAGFGKWAKGVSMPAGIIGGAVLGAIGSSILGKDEGAKAAPASPVDVAGAAG